MERNFFLNQAGECKYSDASSIRTNIKTDFTYATHDFDEAKIKAALAMHGPVGVSIEVTHNFQFYQ
jgi:hypothetical protein